MCQFEGTFVKAQLTLAVNDNSLLEMHKKVREDVIKTFILASKLLLHSYKCFMVEGNFKHTWWFCSSLCNSFSSKQRNTQKNFLCFQHICFLAFDFTHYGAQKRLISKSFHWRFLFLLVYEWQYGQFTNNASRQYHSAFVPLNVLLNVTYGHSFVFWCHFDQCIKVKEEKEQFLLIMQQFFFLTKL